MNLHQIVRGPINAVNPDVIGQVYASTGSTTAGNGTRVPTYATAYSVAMQIQPLSPTDLKQIDALNIQGVDRTIYVNGAIHGVERPQGKGGDLLYARGVYWLVVVLLEPWDGAGWTKVGVAQQMTGPPA